MDTALAVVAAAAGIGAIVWGAETFAEHLARAAAGLGVSLFALAILLAGAEPEELATAVAAARRGAPGIAFGDVVGANVAVCLVALGVGAWIAPLPFGRRVLRYAVLGLPVGAVAVWFSWDGAITRAEGLVLVGLYAGYVAAIWLAERRPPAIGEVAELEPAPEEGAGPPRRGRELTLVLVGLAAMVGGAMLLVDAVRDLTHAEASQTRLSLTVVGFATAFELVVLAWAAARRGISEAVVAGVMGSFAYNATMTLGVAAAVRPLRLRDAAILHAPMLFMLAALGGAILLALPSERLGRRHAIVLLGAYLAFLALSLR